jgi:phosphatidate cytidylyltransferase
VTAVTQAGTESKRKRSAGRNLPAAIGVAVVLLAVIVGSLFLYRPIFLGILVLSICYAVYELSRAFATAGYFITLSPLVAGTVALLITTWFRGADGLVVAALVTACAVFLWRLGDGAAGYLRDASVSLLVLLYLPTLAGFTVLLVHHSDGPARIIAFLATVVCSDTGGYATGVLIGRHPLAPVISKGKTIEGLFGSLTCCTGAGIALLTVIFHQAWWKGLLFGLAIALTATVGDLGESMIKRDLGIKDMGHLLPGHGGIMDRLDSLLPCAAVAYLLLSTLAPA